MSARSDTAQTATTAPTCSTRRPWRRTKAFCAPIATIRPRPRARPADAASSAGVPIAAHARKRASRSPVQDSEPSLASLFVDLDLAQLRALDATVSAGTLEAAARALHVTPSAVSQRLRALEVATGRVLLVRSKPVRLTESGRPILRLARQVALLTADAARELGGYPQQLPPLPIAV